MKETLSTRVERCDDGKYRWTYEMSLFKNPTFFFLVWKIFFFIIIGLFAVTMIIDAVEWPAEFGSRILETLKIMGYFLIGMTVIVVVSYLIYAAVMGGSYIVEFEMDEKGISHRQIASQAKKARKIAAATVVAGIAACRVSTVAAGINSSRTEMYSDFSRVRKVKSYPKRNTIKVNAPLSHNQVYALKEDFDFVKDYIISHCPNLK